MHKIIVFCCVAISMLSLIAAPTVTDIVAKQRFPWNGLVDITCRVTGIEKSAPYKFYIEAVQPDEGITNKLAQFWVVQNGTKQSNFKVTANDEYHLIWDAKADLGAVSCPNMIVCVGLEDGRDKVQLWEGGPYWATTNIGAEKPWESGYYFWWGDTVGYRRENDKWVASDGSSLNFSFSYSNVKTGGKNVQTLKKEGWITAEGVLTPEHDAAHIHWGGGWRMPTQQEFNDLNTNCNWTWMTTENGVSGYMVSGKGLYATASIFFPRTGRAYETSLNSFSTYGYYWSSVPNSDNFYCGAYDLYFYSGTHYTDYRYDRNYGESIRPVQGIAIVDCANDSESFLLNTIDGPLNISPITYKSSWIGDNANSTVVIADNGVDVYRGSGEGEFEWQPTTVGKHVLTYTTYINDVAQGEVYEATVYSGLKYEVVDGKAVITEAAIDSDKIVILNEVDGYQVGEISDGVFADCDGIKDVTMPGMLCSSMAAVFPDSYASITNVTLTGNLAQLPTGAFTGCAALESVTLAQSGATIALGGEKGWRFDEEGVLRSGKITHSEESSMRMVVQGEGRLTYRWKASCEYYNRFILDYAYLSVDGVAKGYLKNNTLNGVAIGGNTDWEEVSMDIMGEGAHEIAWTFAKDDQDDESSIGEDCAWVDAIKFEPFVKVSFNIAGAEGSAPSLMKDVCGESVVLPTAAGFAKEKHTFVGWSDGVQTYAPGESYQVGVMDVVLTAVYEANMLPLPVITSADVLSGGTITNESATIEIASGDGTAIYYTLDGTLPTSESLLYSGAFEADGLGLVTVKAIAVRDNCFDSEVAEFTFTRRPYSAAECLNASGMTFALSGDAVWERVLDGAAHDGDAALKSGKISHNQEVVIETKVSGAGTISFWWKSSSERFRDWKLDIVSFTVDGVEQAWLGGVKDWTNIVVDITGNVEHTLCWTYKKDEQGSVDAEDDCAWLDEVVWTPALVETQTTPVAVPFAWLQEKYPTITDAAAFEAKANEVAANGANKVWECYVAGIDPTDATAKFVTKIEMVDGKPVITWDPDMNDGAGKTGVRTYKILGSTDLKTWTEVADEAEANFNFFKVEVSMP